MTVVEARKRFGDTCALNGAQLELRRGEWLGLLGPNGAGKTTLIRAIAGRVRLEAGRMTLLGREIDQRRDVDGPRARLGIVPQEIALYGNLTPLENLQTFGVLHGVTGGELRTRCEWALRWTGLDERARDLVRTFSGGMKRRLNIACGVLHRPEVVLLDEPTAGVDPQSRERIWEMLAGLQRDGAALLLTTHQLDEAQNVCQRIVIIDGGKVAAEGTLDELVSRTVGTSRRVTFTLDRPAGATLGDGWTIDEKMVRAQVRDVAEELPALLMRVRSAGLRVEDVKIEAPSLHAVFLHLTGKELRE